MVPVVKALLGVLCCVEDPACCQVGCIHMDGYSGKLWVDWLLLLLEEVGGEHG